MTAKFKVVEPGKVHIWGSNDINREAIDDYDQDMSQKLSVCSRQSQLFRLLVASFSVERAFKTLEVGLQSNVGLRSSGITNFNSLVTEDFYAGSSGVPSVNNSYQAYIDAEFCGKKDDGGMDTASKLSEQTHTAKTSTWNVLRSRHALQLLPHSLPRHRFNK